MLTAIVLANLLFSAVFCYENITVGEYSKEIFNEIKEIENHYQIDLKPDCQKMQEVQLDFLLYTRSNPQAPIFADPATTKQIDPDKKTVFIVHGWLQNANSTGIQKLKDAYLERYDANVFILDWSQISSQAYTVAYCHMQRLSIYISKFLCQLDTDLGIPLNELHVVGYSLGAQLAGVSAQYVKSKCKRQIARITGLDPTGPLFQNLPTRRRLDKTDATFVDVIHTDQMKFGYSGNIGHSDFYPNCGQLQPGCQSVKDVKAESKMEDIMCSHHRSLDYMIESVEYDSFVGVTCGLCPRYCRQNMINEIYTIMGEGASPQSQSHNKFYLATRNVPPYGEGWTLAGAKLP